MQIKNKGYFISVDLGTGFYQISKKYYRSIPVTYILLCLALDQYVIAKYHKHSGFVRQHSLFTALKQRGII